MRLVDWRFAEATAVRLVPPGPRLDLADATAVVDDLRRLALEAEQHVAGYTGLPADGNGAAFAVVDRPGWIRSNVAGFADLVDPMLDTVVGEKLRSAGPVMTLLGPRATGLEVGTLLAYLSARVLGQFELFGPAPADAGAGRLTLVAPNIVVAERALRADPHDFRLWVCLHEVTHRSQFAAAPWLRGHVRGLLHDYLNAANLDPRAVIGRLRSAVGDIAGSVRGRSEMSVLEIVQTPEQRAVLDRVTGLMSLLEGHADVVMDGVGPTVIPTVASIRRAFERRRQGGSPLDRVIRRLLGLDMKMRQYAEGAVFVRAVVDAIGMTGLNRIWTAPELLPDAAEIRNPAAWLARTGGAPAASA